MTLLMLHLIPTSSKLCCAALQAASAFPAVVEILGEKLLALILRGLRDHQMIQP
jgi:hypothetical protein